MTLKKLKTIIGTALAILGFYLLVDNFIPVDPRKYRKSKKELTALTAYLINPPQYFQFRGKNGGPYLRLELDQIVGVFFENENEFLDATDWKAVLKEIKYHDTVCISVLKNRFGQFYENKSSLSEFQKIINHPIDRFNFYSLQFKGKEYVHDIYQAAEKRRKDNLKFTTAVYLLIAAAGIWTVKTKK